MVIVSASGAWASKRISAGRWHIVLYSRPEASQTAEGAEDAARGQFFFPVPNSGINSGTKGNPSVVRTPKHTHTQTQWIFFQLRCINGEYIWRTPRHPERKDELYIAREDGLQALKPTIFWDDEVGPLLNVFTFRHMVYCLQCPEKHRSWSHRPYIRAKAAAARVFYGSTTFPLPGNGKLLHPAVLLPHIRRSALAWDDGNYVSNYRSSNRNLPLSLRTAREGCGARLGSSRTSLQGSTFKPPASNRLHQLRPNSSVWLQQACGM